MKHHNPPRIALIAHDKKKDEMIGFVSSWVDVLSTCKLVGTGTTALRVHEATGLEIHGYLSGPLGGDLQIGALVATGELDLVIFFRDPMTAQPHEPDVSALMRACDVHNVALASNINSAELCLHSLAKLPHFFHQ